MTTIWVHFSTFTSTYGYILKKDKLCIYYCNQDILSNTFPNNNLCDYVLLYFVGLFDLWADTAEQG